MRKRSTLILIVIAMLAIVSVASASWVSEMLFGRHVEYTRAGVNIGIDRYVPEEWFSIAALKVKYWEDKDVIYQGEKLSITVMITTENLNGRDFAFLITDENKAISGGDNFSFPKREKVKGDWDPDGKRWGGLRCLGTFRGRAGYPKLDTKDLSVGTHFGDVYVLADGKYQKFTEKPISFRIAPPLPEVIEALKDSSEETLKAWGLESYPTLAKVEDYQPDNSKWSGTVHFADRGHMDDVKLNGTPEEGMFIGVFTNDMLAGIVKVDGFTSGESVVRSHSSSRFLSSLRGREREIRLAYVVKVRVSAATRELQLTATQVANLATFPDSTDPMSPVFGIRNAMYEMATAPSPVRHLNTPYLRPNGKPYEDTASIWRAYQEFTKTQNSYTLAPEKEGYVPVGLMKHARVVRLGAGGVPVVKIEGVQTSRIDTQGWFPGAASIIGQAFRRPDTISVKATGGAGGNAVNNTDIDNTNNNSNSNANTLVDNTAINIGEGEANADASGGSGAESNSGSF